MSASSVKKKQSVKTNARKSNENISSLQNESRLITDKNGTIIFATRSFISLCGLKEDLNGKNISYLFDNKKIDELASKNNEIQIITIKNTGKKIALQFDFINIKKEESYFIVSAEETTAGDKLKKYVSEKIKEQTNQKIKKQDINPYPFMDMLNDICLVSDIENNYIYSNKSFEKLLGYSKKALLKLNFIDLIHKEDRPFVHRSLLEFYQNNNGNNYNFDARTIAKDGTIYWLEWNFKIEQNQIFSLGRDITSLKKQEDRLERQNKELSEAESIAHMGHWRWRVGNETLRLSTEIYNIFGFDNNDSFTPTLNNINKMIFNEDAGRMERVFQRAIIEQNDYEIDFRLKRNDGQTRYIRCEGRCEIDNDDDVTALYGIMQDVTETVLREQDLMKAKESAERAYAAKSTFLANMSHELRTPLNAIIGFSEMMQHQLLGPIGNDKYTEYISGIRESGEHLLDLITDILDMSKIEAGKYELNLEKFNLIKTIKLALHMIESRALDQNIKISTDIKNEQLEIIADRRAVMQMILNLLSNAVKFSKENGKITVSCIEQKNNVLIKVKDNGIGIPANKLANITNPFEQVECSYTREHEGSGLGLAITKELSESHGGELKIESKLDIGTTVTIVLPYKANS